MPAAHRALTNPELLRDPSVGFKGARARYLFGLNNRKPNATARHSLPPLLVQQQQHHGHDQRGQ